jgi:hypothetical protein
MSRCTKMGPGGNTITNSNTKFIFNRYRGEGGIGASTIVNRNAKNRLASFCKIRCTNLVTPTLVTPTILVYNTSQGPSFVWNGVIFTLDTNLSNFSYSAITSTLVNDVPSRDNLIAVTIGNSVTTIAEGVFYYSRITTVTIPNSVTSIGAYAFYQCGLLANVTLPNNPLFTTISENMFRDTRLTSITIPNSVTNIGAYAFVNTQLTSLTIPDSVTSIGENAFAACALLTTVNISNDKATDLGNQFTPRKVWTSPGIVLSPDFYGAPENVNFVE